MTAKEVYKALRWHFSDAWMHLQNSCVFGWEADFLCWVDKKYWCEVEVKVSRADFKRDFTHKPEKHRCLNLSSDSACMNVLSAGGEYEAWNTFKGTLVAKGKATFIKNQLIPNRFYFACPEGLIQPNEVPKYAGLIWILPDGKTRLVRRPKTLHRYELPIMQSVAIKQSFVIKDLLRTIEQQEFETEQAKTLQL
jgi:hypothetical protein